MKKYKLKKDLPLAKAGTIVEADNKAKNLVRVYTESGNARSGKLICQIEKEKISEWLEEIREKPKNIFRLTKGDKFYYIDILGVIRRQNWDGFESDIFLRDVGNFFLTLEEAQKEIQKRKAIQRIKELCWVKEIELADINFVNNSDNLKFAINFNASIKKFIITHFCISIDTSIFFFKKEDDAKEILEKCESDLKIIFDVE